jgi:hypothetical protein
MYADDFLHSRTECIVNSAWIKDLVCQTIQEYRIAEPFKMGPRGCSETSVTICTYTLHIIPDDRRPLVLWTVCVWKLNMSCKWGEMTIVILTCCDARSSKCIVSQYDKLPSLVLFEMLPPHVARLIQSYYSSMTIHTLQITKQRTSFIRFAYQTHTCSGSDLIWSVIGVVITCNNVVINNNNYYYYHLVWKNVGLVRKTVTLVKHVLP